MPRSKVWQRRAGSAIDSAALSLIKAGTATVEPIPSAQKPVVIRYTGPCPECRHVQAPVYPVLVVRRDTAADAHETADRFMDTVHVDHLIEHADALAEAFGRDGWAGDVAYTCQCGQPHPKPKSLGEPEKNETGCGTIWSFSYRPRGS